MSVSISGAGPFAFGTTPTVADGWSTGVIGVNNATYGTVAGLDAQAQVIDPTTAAALGANGNVPPAVLAGFQQNTAGLYLQSRSTGGGANVLVLTLTNITGSVITSMTINYTFNELVGTLGEELPGWHAYYSLSGAANSWTKIPAFSTATPGALSATLLWAVGRPTRGCLSCGSMIMLRTGPVSMKAATPWTTLSSPMSARPSSRSRSSTGLPPPI